MKGIDAYNIYKSIKINILEQNTQVRHSHNKLWIHLNPSKINIYLAGACRGKALPGPVGNIKRLRGIVHVYPSKFHIIFHICI